MRKLLLAVSTWEWLLLLLLLPLLWFPFQYGALALLALPLLWLIRKAATGHFFAKTPFNIALLVLALALLISFVAVFNIALSFPKIAGVVMGIALFFAAVEHCQQRENGLWNIVAVVILAGTAAALLAIPFARWQPPLAFLNQTSALLPGRLSSLPGAIDGIVNLNEVAGVLAWIVPLTMALFLGYRRRLWRSSRWYLRLVAPILVVLLAVNLFVLLASRSRGGLLSVASALLVMLAIEFRWGRWLLVVGVIGGALLLFSFGPDQLFSAPAADVENYGLQERSEIWSRGIYALEDYPLTGLSMNGFRKAVHVFYPLTIVPPGTDIAHAHNQVLQAGLDLGLFGLVAYLAIWLTAAGLLWQGLSDKRGRSKTVRPLQIGLAGSLTAGWLFGIVDAIALGARPGFIWWLLLALVAAATVMALYKVRRRRIEAPAAV